MIVDEDGIKETRDREPERRERRGETPEPEGWRPHGYEW